MSHQDPPPMTPDKPQPSAEPAQPASQQGECGRWLDPNIHAVAYCTKQKGHSGVCCNAEASPQTADAGLSAPSIDDINMGQRASDLVLEDYDLDRPPSTRRCIAFMVEFAKSENERVRSELAQVKRERDEEIEELTKAASFDRTARESAEAEVKTLREALRKLHEALGPALVSFEEGDYQEAEAEAYDLAIEEAERALASHPKEDSDGK